MALFKIHKDNKTLPSSKVEGYAYFHSGTGEFFVDTSNTVRMQMSAQYAQALRTVTADSAATGGYTVKLLEAGTSTKPVYFKNGVPQECGGSLAVSITGNAASANKVSGASLDFYFNGDPEWTWGGLSGSFGLNFIGGTNISVNPQYDSDNQTYNITINNDYSLPTASSSTKGGVKTGAAITNTTGYTACAIKDGVIYYKDTNTTYTLSGLGGIGTVSATGTAPLTLSATKDGTSVAIAGSIATATNANLGVVTTNSTVTSASGLIACPIIDGIVYYKDTNTTYSSLKSPYSLTLKVNSGSSALYTYDGSAAKTLNIIAGSNVTVTGTTAGNITIAATDTTYTFTNSGPTLAWGQTATIGTVGGTALTVTMPANPNTDTHYTTHLYLGASSTATSNVTTATSNPYIVVTDNSTARNAIQIKGSGATSVSGNSGVITISSSNTTYSAATASAAGLMSASDKSKLDAITASADAVSFTQSLTSGTKVGTITINGTETALYCQTNTNTDTKVTTAAQTSTTIYVTGCTGATTGGLQYNTSVYISSSVLYGACWNDYAEYRKTKDLIEGGRVVVENGDDTLSLATERLMPGANIVSDTFGFAIGETETSKTPLAVSGRVLAYPYEDRESYKPGDPVCSGPNGTVSKMTRKEVMQYPDRMIGTVSAIPDYETWGTGNVEVNNRIWIKVL